MKFKTIVLTKNKMRIAAAAILCAAAVGIAAPIIIKSGGAAAVRVEEAFSPADDYESILDEGIPVAGADDGGILKKLTGIDLSDPSSVIDEYSAAIKGTTPQSEQPSENGYEGEPTEPAEPQETPAPEENTQPAALPDHNAVCSSVGLKINNATDYNVDLDAMCADDLAITPEDGKPLVLIMHTHTTECYCGDEMSGETERNTDENVNVIAVGNEIENVLTSYGIGVIHDKTYHDYPSYQSSYTRALSTIESVLEENPSIQVVLDVQDRKSVV